MNASCECGNIAFKTPLEKPLGLYICHCIRCRLETAGPCAAGAIFPAFEWERSVMKEDLGVYVYVLISLLSCNSLLGEVGVGVVGENRDVCLLPAGRDLLDRLTLLALLTL